MRIWKNTRNSAQRVQKVENIKEKLGDKEQIKKGANPKLQGKRCVLSKIKIKIRNETRMPPPCSKSSKKKYENQKSVSIHT